MSERIINKLTLRARYASLLKTYERATHQATPSIQNMGMKLIDFD